MEAGLFSVAESYNWIEIFNKWSKPSNNMTEEKVIWNVPVSAIFPLVLTYYREEKDEVNLRLEYQQRIQLLAYFKQEKLGPFTPDKDVETGYFDVVGSDRRKAWIALEEMTKADAQLEIIKLLEMVDSHIKETVLERWRAKQSNEEKERAKGVKVQNRDANVRNGLEDKKQVTEDSAQAPIISETIKRHNSSHCPTLGHNNSSSPHRPPIYEHENKLDSNVLAPAALWCSPKAAKQFISQVRAASPSGHPENQLVLNPGESVDVQVPTSTQASAVFFEFVTEKGDIGFGLTFQRKSESAGNSWPLQELLPITKRNCSVDLILGNHRYEHQGLYTLKFDNSHSPAESKVVYYKVFYQGTAH